MESAVEALTDLLGILLDLLRLIPPIPDKYATASKAGQSSDEVAVRRTQQPLDSIDGRLTWRTFTRASPHTDHRTRTTRTRGAYVCAQLVSPRKSSATAAMKSSGNNKGAKAAGPKPTLRQEIAEWIEVPTLLRSP